MDAEEVLLNELLLQDLQLKNHIYGGMISEAERMVANGLEGALGFGAPNGPTGFPPGNQGVELSQTNTQWINLRWYLISNFRQLISQMYAEHGLVQTLVDVPVDDALRGGIIIQSKELDDDDIEQLQISIDRDDDLHKAGQAEKWNRLYGGAGILILTDQDPQEPLDLAAIGPDTPLEFRAVDMWELFWDKQNTEGYDPEIQDYDAEYFSYYAKTIHKSKVMKLKGVEAPSFIRPRVRGWGLSELESVIRSLNQYMKANDLSFEVLDEFKLDIFKIKNLVTTLLSPTGETEVRRRIGLANRYKNYQNALVMDSEDDYDHKQLSFTGIAETMREIRMQLAADLRFPITKLFGISATGFNSGEDDLEIYNAMVESRVRRKLKYHILKMVEIKCQKLFGFIPDDISIEFKPLRVLSAEQEANVKTQTFSRVFQAKQGGEITTEEFRDMCNKDNLFPIKVDVSEAALQEVEAMADDEQGADEPGADEPTSEKPQLKAKPAPGGKPADGSKPKEAKQTKNEDNDLGEEDEIDYGQTYMNRKKGNK